MGQKELPRLGSSMSFGQTWARNSHQDSAVQFVTAKGGPEAGTKTRQYGLLRPNVGQKEPSRLGSTICYGQTWARKSHQDSAVQFMAKRGPERAIETRQYDLLRPNVGQKEPPRLGSTICNSQELARKSHRDSAVRFVTAKCGPERATETRQYDLLRPNVGQKEPPRLGSTICYCQELARKSHQDSVLRPNVGQKEPPRLGSSFFLRPRVGQKEPPRFGSTICYGQKEPPSFGSTICYDQTWARKSHRDTAVRFVTAKRGPERATETRQFDVFRPNVGQKQPPRLGSTICYRQRWGTRLGSTICYGQDVGRKSNTICYGQSWGRKSHQDSAIEPARKRYRFGSTICYGQT